MKASSSSAASTLTYESDLSEASAYINSHGKSCEEARLFDLVLKKLETVRTKAGNNGDSDNPSWQQRDDFGGRDTRHDSRRDSLDEESLDSSDDLNCRFSKHLPVRRNGQRGSHAEDRFSGRAVQDKNFQAEQDENTTFSEEKLPRAILKLDRRHAIPRPRQKNDILVEIEACTIERRSLSIRQGIRSSLHPTPIETVAVDCVGRVVQLTTHTRALYGIGLEDRVAALYPFEYFDKGDQGDGGRGGKRKLGRYALVDAGFVVQVPKHVDADRAVCLVRLYMTAFQSIQLGIFHSTPTHDRYELAQLAGKSILIQNGHTELGQVIVELVTALGARQIFATGPSEFHNRIRSAGATPLGDQTFSWELFLNEKMSLVLLQEMPSAEIFDHFRSVLDDDCGSIVKINRWPNEQNEDFDNNALEVDDIGCELLSVQDVTQNIKCAFERFKLTCCTQFLTYEGAWTSNKEDPDTWKEDLRFLFALLGAGKLTPHVDELICLDNISETQDNIELYGKKRNSIVCLPSKTITERYSSGDRGGGAAATFNKTANEVTEESYAERFAIDSGYQVKPTAADTLSDFHNMNVGVEGPQDEHLPTPYYNPLLEYRMSESQQNLPVHHDGACVRVSTSSISENSPRSSSSNNGPRRSRLIQRIKTQQHSNLRENGGNKSIQKDPRNTRAQWRKLRRDARIRSKTIERPQEGHTVIKTSCDEQLGLRHHTNNVDQFLITDDFKTEDAHLNEQSLMQQGRGVSPSLSLKRNVGFHHEITEKATPSSSASKDESIIGATRDFELCALQMKNSEDLLTEVSTTKDKQIKCAEEKNGEASSSFQSLMNKWKSIEDNYQI